MTQIRCQHCKAPLPEGAKICRSCGKIQEAGGIAYGVAEQSGGGGAQGVRKTAKAGGSAPKCEVCDGSPFMVQQIEKNPPYLPGVLAFVSFLSFIMALAWHSTIPTILCLLVTGGCAYGAYKIFTAERTYWLCPKCGDTIDIEPETA